MEKQLDFAEKSSIDKIECCINEVEKYINTLCMIIHNCPDELKDEAYCLRLLSRAADVRKGINLLKRTFNNELK
jgi:hypothetical protein